MSYLSAMRGRTLACISLFSKVPLQFFGEAKGFNPRTVGVRVTGQFHVFCPGTRTTWSFHWSFKKYLCQPIVVSSDAHALALSAAVSSFKIGQWTWKVDNVFHSIRTKVIEKRKMVETFSEKYATSQAKESVWEGELLRNIVQNGLIDMNYTK